ncbi:PAS domain-containing protein [Virgibacillus xinjiangensis]|uniref:PAS domain-containing protein n=1 Tax=Virgibacillus xinjiangensis TaxID=393090 RepID=A0ABV7CRA9_9BACI
MIIVWDEGGNARYISKSFEKMLGYDLSQVRTLKWHELVSPQGASFIKNTVDKAAEHSQTFTASLLHTNGEYIRSECNLKKNRRPNDRQPFLRQHL